MNFRPPLTEILHRLPGWLACGQVPLKHRDLAQRIARRAASGPCQLSRGEETTLRQVYRFATRHELVDEYDHWGAER